MATNAVSRKYSNISFEDIRDHLAVILKAKGGSLADFSDSSYGRIMVELFAGSADLMAYYAESAFENAFMESAYSSSSIYANARMLGYSVRRPVPAKAGIGIQTTKTGIYNTIRVRIPKGTVFTMSSTTLTAMDDMEFYYDRDLDTDLTGLMTLVSGRAVVAEGMFKTISLVSTGKQNQTLLIPDPTFSDYFGENDPNYADDGNVAHRSAGFTTVTSDATLMDNIDNDVVIDDKLYWRVSRRGLIDPAKENTINDIDNFIEGQDNYTVNYTVEISTANDGNVQLKFGDGLKSAIPYGIINVKYFSTNGEEGNLLNVTGNTLASTSSKIVITQGDGTESDITLNDLNIALTTDIRSGLDIENDDSIKANAPALFNSLDRLVNRMSYKIFLRRYSDVKYATAFGEDILNTKLLNGGINVKYMNQIRFSALKSLYREKDNTYYPTTADEYFLDGFKVNGLMYTWEYDYQDVEDFGFSEEKESTILRISNTLKKTMNNTDQYPHNPFTTDKEVDDFVAAYLTGLMPTYPFNYKVFSANLTPLDFVEEGSELYSIMTALNQRSMVTVGGGFHSYVYPSVHSMETNMDITLYKGNNFTDVKERVKNAVYKYLCDNTEFATAIYRSKLESIVHTLTEVAGVDITFHPVDDGYNDLDMANLDWLGDTTYEFIVPGSITSDAFEFTLEYTVNDSLGQYTKTKTFTVPEQSGMQTRLAEYYKYKVAPIMNKITDLDIDKYVAYIWEQVMQQVYTPIHEAVNAARNSGDVIGANVLYRVMESVKGWDMGATMLTFKDTEYIKSMTEINGSTLYDYLKYGMEYIKLVRNVLSYYVTLHLIDENGNITQYSNDNEIVQITIPTDKINLSVSLESSLLTE